MALAHSTAVPAPLARLPLRTFRPQDATDVYAHPRPELARLVKRGVLHRAAPGYFIVVPPDQTGRPWIPNLEATAAGIATAIYGPDDAIVMGISAARLHHAIPRALATAVIAVPRRHRTITLTDRAATIRFLRRDTRKLDAERADTPLGPALVTTPEQTVLDLARWPSLGDTENEVPTAVTSLFRRSDRERLTALAADQGLTTALTRAETWARAAS
ncbi:type IV toxin-antitoxin system AbiEi family antitoxin [Rhodococcus sp. NPDC019627]|uniref:type IV toxin-antitoxin system AbiEi family antitoxin domain-containing protein n=1 Tax=unclassified Rhodococcus (in: high G+C Gram-positive bacteria) TaxID=192944 RepID=UPI0033EEFC8E